MTARPYHFFLHHSYVHTVGRKANTHTVMRCMQMQHKPATRVRSILMSDAAHATCPCKQTRTSALLHVALSLRLHLSLPPIPSAGLSVSLSLPPTLPTSQLYRVENTQDRHSQARHGAMHLHVPCAVQVCAGGSFPSHVASCARHGFHHGSLAPCLVAGERLRPQDVSQPPRLVQRVVLHKATRLE